MTGNDIFDRIIMLLGYNDCCGSVAGEAMLRARTLHAVNTIGADLCSMPEVSSLEEELNIDGTAREALIYGVGMMIATSEDDGALGGLFGELYNAKRASLKSAAQSIKDCLPVSGG